MDRNVGEHFQCLAGSYINLVGSGTNYAGERWLRLECTIAKTSKVYVARATDSKHGPVAIKYSYPSVIEREEKILLRLKEACVVGIPKIYGTCYWPPFRGITLQLFAQNLATEKMDPEKVVAMGKVMVSTLQAVHNLGIIHHDVKPENIVTSDYQKFCLIDWGAARDKAGSLPEDRIGTPGFMSVRILEGKPGGEQDDLESLLYTMVYLFDRHLPWLSEEPTTTSQCLALARTKKSFRVELVAFQEFLDICREEREDFGPSDYAKLVTLLESICDPYPQCAYGRTAYLLDQVK